MYINIYRYCMYPYVKLDCRYCMVLDSKSVFHSPIKPPFLRCVMRGFTKSEQCNTNAVLQTEFHLGPGENVPTSSPGQPMKASFSGILVPTIPPSSRSKQRTSVKLLHSEVFDPGDGVLLGDGVRVGPVPGSAGPTSTWHQLSDFSQPSPKAHPEVQDEEAEKQQTKKNQGGSPFRGGRKVGEGGEKTHQMHETLRRFLFSKLDKAFYV